MEFVFLGIRIILALLLLAFMGCAFYFFLRSLHEENKDLTVKKSEEKTGVDKR